MSLDNISIGVDIEDINRFIDKEALFYAKIFTVEEQKYCNKKQVPAQHYAARFCAKEAFVKALCGLGWGKEFIALNEINIYHDDFGCPQISYEKAKGIMAKVSLSHDQTKAMACVIVSKS